MIAVSGFVDRLEQARTSAAGFTDMLPKPVDTDLLLRTVELHLPRRSEHSPGRGRRVVVADDDPVLLRLLTRLLEDQDLRVTQAASGAEVLELVRADAPDAFVLDVLMPSPDGFRTCALLRQDPRFRAAPIVLVTSAFVSADDRLLADSVGADAFVLRSPGSEAVIDALLAAFAAPARRHDVAAAPSLDAAEYHRRVLQQLERQAALSVSQAERASHQAVELSVLGAIAESLVVRRDTGPDLQVVLEQCLDTGGISAGAIFVLDGGAVVGRSLVGLGAEVAAELATSLSTSRLEATFETEGPTTLEPASLAPALSAYGSALLLPLTSQHERIGVLALLSHSRGETAPDRLAFLRNVAGQIGQALALAGSFARLSESEARFRQLAEGIDDVFWIRDVASDRVLYVNPAYERLFGRPCADVFRDGRSWLEGVHPDDLADVRRAHAAGVAGGDYAPTYRIIRPDGSLRWIRVHSGHVKDDAGRVVRLVGVATDVTELKQAAEFQERVARLATFNVEVGAALTRGDDLKAALRGCTEAAVQHLDAAAACIWLLDARAQVLALHACSGPAAPLVDRHASAAVGTLDIEAIAAAAGLPASASYPLQVGGQQIGLFAVFARQPIAEDTRHKLAFVADVIAVAVRRNDDAAAKATLEAQLRQAQKMEAVGRLAGGVAHDFNNLLTVILGYADMVSSKLRPDDPMRRHVEQIHKAGIRATSLTRQLLVFSRHQALDRKVLDLNAILRDLEKMLGRLIGEDLEISFVLGQGLGRILADAGQVEQVILNLCVNARDAMPRGGRLTIETANAELDGRANGLRGPVEPGRYVMLAVSDTGTGIPPEVLEHMFEPFFTTKDASKGTGLGLSTVYGIVQTAGGAISVYTEVGLGSTFKVYLPRVDAAPDAQEAHAEVGQLRGSETILLVEDDELVRDLARGILEANGYRVLVAENGGAALLVCEKHAGGIDLVLTDVVMPNMSGRELVLRLAKVRQGLRVLYFSGYTSGVVLHDDVVGSGAAFLQKPFSADALARKVREVLDAPAAPAPSSRPTE